MKPEELVKMLRDAEMDDEAIKGLLNDALGMLEGPEQPAEPQEAEEPKDEEKEFNEFYGY